MLWVLLVLLILWATGFITHVGGDLIHLLLVVFLIVAIYYAVTGPSGGLGARELD